MMLRHVQVLNNAKIHPTPWKFCYKYVTNIFASHSKKKLLTWGKK